MLVVCRVQQITTLINIYKCKSAFIIAKERHTSIFFLLHECYIFEFLFIHTDCILICSNEMTTTLRRYLKT